MVFLLASPQGEGDHEVVEGVASVGAALPRSASQPCPLSEGAKSVFPYEMVMDQSFV